MQRSPQQILDDWKPAASRRTHLLAAAGVWTIVGTGLLIAGVHWCQSMGFPQALYFLLPGILLGALKGYFVLGRSARRSVLRIESRPDGTCLFGFIGWGGWGLVLVMMGAGFLLRHSPLPRSWLGLIYSAIGIALLVGSRVFWRTYRRLGGIEATG